MSVDGELSNLSGVFGKINFARELCLYNTIIIRAELKKETHDSLEGKCMLDHFI